MDIIKKLAQELAIKEEQAKAAVQLIDEGNTIPFIARYRKEMTGALNDETLRNLHERLLYLRNLEEKKEQVINAITEQDKMTDDLKKKILAAETLVAVDDLYRPYRPKKQTRATKAKEKGLEPLANILLLQATSKSMEEEAQSFVNEAKGVANVKEALAGAKDIIAEMIADKADYRKSIRNCTMKQGRLVVKAKDEKAESVYEMYYDYEERVKFIKPNRVLAINRGEKEGILSVNIDVDSSYIINYLEKKVIKKSNTSEEIYVKEAILDSYKRLIFPSVEREIRSELKETAEVTAIDNFSKNVENLLLTPPMKGKTVLGYDPAFRTGCKLAVLDSTGKPLKIEVIYPTQPHNKIEESKKIVLDLIDKYNIDIIAIGNGTASRESEAFIAECIKESKRKVEYIIVSEAGASVYSASKLAINEFPDLTVEKRSAISIGRRLQDSLSELVKIDPKSIGVGLYQHDVTPKKLDESLNFVVTKVVNQVGVNVNTASSSLLSYVSGMNKKAIDAILNERDLKGKFTSREEIKKLKGITPKVYEQAIGFIRIPDGVNPLDKTSIHPESYEVTKKLLESIGMNLNDIGTDKLKEELDNIDIDKICLDIKTDKYTLKDIIDDLEKPGRDLRDNMPKPILKSDVLTLDDLHIGDKLQGTVRNVVDFGVFIDIGLHNDGLAHISKLTNKYIKHPSEVVSVGDIVDCYVIDINKEKEKVSLSLIEI